MTFLFSIPSPHVTLHCPHSDLSHSQRQGPLLHDRHVAGCVGVSDVISQPSGDFSTVLVSFPFPHEAEHASQRPFFHSPQGQAPALHDWTVDGFIEVGVQSEGGSTVLVFVPFPHVAVQFPHSDMTQSQGQSPVLHCSVSVSFPLHVPLLQASVITVRFLVLVPPSHALEHSDQLDQVDQVQSVLQACSSSFSASQTPTPTRSPFFLTSFLLLV